MAGRKPDRPSKGPRKPHPHAQVPAGYDGEPGAVRPERGAEGAESKGFDSRAPRARSARTETSTVAQRPKPFRPGRGDDRGPRREDRPRGDFRGGPRRDDRPRSGPPRDDRPRGDFRGGPPRRDDRPRGGPPRRDERPRGDFRDRPRSDRPVPTPPPSAGARGGKPPVAPRPLPPGFHDAQTGEKTGGAPRPRSDARGGFRNDRGPRRNDRGPRRDDRGARSGGGFRDDRGGPRRDERDARDAKKKEGPVLFMRTRRWRPDPYAAPARLVVLHDDADVLAVDKPPGMNVAVENEAEGATSLQTLASEHLAEKGEGVALLGPRARLVHRIDKDTTGVVLFAKTPRAQAALGADWEAGRVEKVYWALVRGTPESDGAVIDKPIGRHRDRKALRAIDGLEPQDARTRYRVLERFGDRFALLEVRPLTGRTHQIRVHLKAIGNPLAVDALYGEEGAPPPVISRLTLHARYLTFTQPTKRRRVTVESPLPPDFAAALDALRGNSRVVTAGASSEEE